MSRAERSINQRLHRAKSAPVRLETALEWAQDWRAEQSDLVARLGRAVALDDYDLQCRITGELKAVTEKRFGALPGVLRALIGEVDADS